MPNLFVSSLLFSWWLEAVEGSFSLFIHGYLADGFFFSTLSIYYLLISTYFSSSCTMYWPVFKVFSKRWGLTSMLGAGHFKIFSTMLALTSKKFLDLPKHFSWWPMFIGVYPLNPILLKKMFQVFWSPMLRKQLLRNFQQCLLGLYTPVIAARKSYIKQILILPPLMESFTCHWFYGCWLYYQFCRSCSWLSLPWIISILVGLIPWCFFSNLQLQWCLMCRSKHHFIPFWVILFVFALSFCSKPSMGFIFLILPHCISSTSLFSFLQ